MQEIQADRQRAHKLSPQDRVGAWFAFVSCGLAAMAGVYLGAAAWLSVVFLLLSAVAMWRALGFSLWSFSKTYSSSGEQGYWQDWLNGWYWQTNENHELVLLKPDSERPADWLMAGRLIGAGQFWWSHWTATEQTQVLAVQTQLEVRLKALLPVDVGPLPWPPEASEQNAGQARPCRVVGVPRYGPEGGFLGFHGVIRPEAEPAIKAEGALPACAPTPAESAIHAVAMTEAEQEVLRYALSHDLRAPLRVVDGFSRILKEDYGRALDRIGNDHLDRVLAATARMNGMIDAILAQAQLSQAPIERSAIDMSALAREVAEEQLAARRSDLGGGGQALDVEWVIAEGLTAQGDPPLIRRVLDNLIGNALKYSGKVAHPRIEVGMAPATNPSVYFVRDNGAGFDMQHADKLFGLFQRLHSTKDFPGTGVGLAGVQNIVRRHGGRVWAEASPGQGACFYFTLIGSGGVQSKPVSAVAH